MCPSPCGSRRCCVRRPTASEPSPSRARRSATSSDALADDHPGVREQVFTDDGTLHRFLNVYVNDDDVRYTGGLATAVRAGDEVTLLPAVAGGAA